MNGAPTYLFLKLNIWLCMTAVIMVVASAMALSIPLHAVGGGLLLAPLLFYVIYVEDRRTVSDEDQINNPHRTRLVQRYRTELLATEIFALICYELLLVWLVAVTPGRGVGFLLLGQLPFGVLLLYGSLKQYPTFDSLAVGGTWAFMIVFSVVVSTTHEVTMDLFAVFGAWFLIVFAGVESRNLQDLDGDTATDKTTLAGHLGRPATTIMVRTLKSTGVIIFWYIAGIWVAGIVIGYLLLLTLFRRITQNQDERIEIRTDQTNAEQL